MTYKMRTCRDCVKRFKAQGMEALCPGCLAKARRKSAAESSRRRYLKTWSPTTRLCVDCCKPYQIERKPGRPFTRCEEHR